MVFARNAGARRYVLRVNGEGVLRITIPRRGSQKAAWEVARRHLDWIEEQLRNVAENRANREWRNGTEIWFRGRRVPIVVDLDARRVRFADQEVSLDGAPVRGAVERHLRGLAGDELEQRTRELAAQHGVTVGSVTVRDQRSRWGSCSARGTISLSWRLILMPDWVRDYIILHELMHRRELNHSVRFWRHVKAVCPHYRVAELWLKQHQRQLR